jgi:hypothetical protein
VLVGTLPQPTRLLPNLQDSFAGLKNCHFFNINFSRIRVELSTCLIHCRVVVWGVVCRCVGVSIPYAYTTGSSILTKEFSYSLGFFLQHRDFYEDEKNGHFAWVFFSFKQIAYGMNFMLI